ncbi:MAG: hypothetical protein KFKLKKLM_01189 [Flavobacteriales bacterium]|nr:hypothetical protein [Flavobacteriales bacterium]
MKQISILTSISLLIIACSQKPTVTIADLDWIIGTRSSQQDQMLIYESWSKTNEELLTGKSYYTENGDTVLLETIEIKQVDNELYYCPAVSNQNGGQAIEFKLTSKKPNQLVFENPEHDFPKKIVYIKDGNNINAWIEGDGKKVPFYMTKIN